MSDYEKYKEYSLPIFTSSSLNKITKKDLTRTDYCIAVSISDNGGKYSCADLPCSDCLFAIPGRDNCDTAVRDSLIEYMLEHEYLSKADALELALDKVRKE